MNLQSLDPRVNRLNIPASTMAPMAPKSVLDQFATYEVFTQKKEGAPFTFTGAVHAPNPDVAFLFAKEQYSRRSSCVGIWIVQTAHVKLTPYASDDASIYDSFAIDKPEGVTRPLEPYEVFHQQKRGKSHTHVGRVGATSYEEAYELAKSKFGHQKPVVNVWIIKSKNILQSAEEDKDMWVTTAEKKYREAGAYRVMERIKRFKKEQQRRRSKV